MHWQASTALSSLLLWGLHLPLPVGPGTPLQVSMRLSVPIKLAIAVPVSSPVLGLSKFPGTWLVTLCLPVKHRTVRRTCCCHHSAVCLAWDCTSMMIWIPLPWEASQGQAEHSTWPWKLFSGVLRPLPTSRPENNPQQHLLGLHGVWGPIHGDSNPQRPTGSHGDSWPALGSS